MKYAIGDEELGRIAYEAFCIAAKPDWRAFPDQHPSWIRAASAVRAAVSAREARMEKDEKAAYAALDAAFPEFKFAGVDNGIRKLAEQRDAALARASELQEQLAASEHDRLAALDRVTDARGRADQAEARVRNAVFAADAHRERAEYAAEDMRERAATLIEDIGDGTPYPLQAPKDEP